MPLDTICNTPLSLVEWGIHDCVQIRTVMKGSKLKEKLNIKNTKFRICKLNPLLCECEV